MLCNLKIERKSWSSVLVLLISIFASGCFESRVTVTPPQGGSSSQGGNTSAGSSGNGGPIDGCAGGASCFTLSGNATYHWVPALDSVTEGGTRLAYDQIIAKPIRRAIVQAVDSSGNIVGQNNTLDNGNFSVNVPSKVLVTIRVLAKAFVDGYTPDGIGPENCSGASWDVRIVDNTNSKALYTLAGGTAYTSTTSSINLNAALAFNGTAYTNRSAAPFALLDTAVSELELVCEGSANTQFPLVYINWSANNTSTSGSDVTIGNIGTSYFTTENSVPNLYILGDEDLDTDEYDDHVVAHEFGHYIENRIFRADSIGGSHTSGDDLDPRVAFGEGYGNAISAMTFNDPIYVDTNGSLQAQGFMLRINAAPLGDNRGVYSEGSIQYFLWSLYENRIAGAASGTFDRIYDILKNHQKKTPALTTVQSFAAYYNQVYGQNAESLRTLWETDLDTPYNSLCIGSCVGSGDLADPFDLDNDIGLRYGSTRRYQQSSGSLFPAEFWQLYRTISSGTNPTTAHDQTHWANYDFGTGHTNKLGNNRWYRFVPTSSGNITVSVANLSGGYSCSGVTDVLDMKIIHNGDLVTSDTSSSACPSASFAATAGETYVIVVQGYAAAVSGYNLVVSP